MYSAPQRHLLPALQNNQHFIHCSEAAIQQQLPLSAGWDSLCNSTASTQLQFNQQWPGQHQHSVSFSLSAPMLQQHQAHQFGIVPQLLQDLSAVPYPQWQPPLPAQQQQLPQHCAVACAASSTAEGSEGYAPIPSSESSASQSPSVQLSSAHQHSTPTAGQLRARAPRANSSVGGAAAPLRSEQSSPLKQHARNRSTGSTSTGEAVKELLRQAIVRRQHQPAAVQAAPAPAASEDGSVRQRLLAALGTATAQHVSTHPQQQPASPSAIATAGQLLQLVADQVSPVVAASMRQRILQELQAIAEDAAAAGIPFDLECETQHILPQLQDAAATAIRMKQQAAAAAAAATSSAGAATAAAAVAAPSQCMPAGTRATSTPPCFSNMQPQLINSVAGAATAAGVASASLGSMDPVTRSNSDAQLAALLESALSAAAGKASPAAGSYSPVVASAPMAAPSLAPGALLPGARAIAPLRAVSPEVLTQQPPGGMMQLLLSEADLDADQLRGSNKRQRVGPGRSCNSSMLTHSLIQDTSRHPSPGVSPSAFPTAAVGSSPLPCGPVRPAAANSTWSHLPPSSQHLTGSLGGLAGVQEVGGPIPAASVVLSCFDIEQLLHEQMTAAMLEHLGGDLV
jgi:hypothetical protein